MGKILTILLLFVSSFCFSQTYILRKIQLGNPNDSLYLKEGSPDSLWRKNGGTTYSFAFVMKERNYFPAFQLSGTAVQLPVDWNNVINKPSTFPPSSHTHTGVYQPVGSYLVAADITGKLNTNGNGSALTGLTATQVGLGNVTSTYRTILEASGSHIAAKVAGTYAMGMGDPLAISGTGTLYPIQLINIVAADYPTVNGLASKLRLRATVAVNATPPSGNFTIALYPVTSGGGVAALKVYTMGTVVSGSATATVTAPAANSMTSVVGSDFALPPDGVYAIAVVTTSIVAVSSLVHINAQLQIRNN